jgi:oligopeptide/dipeptide ABC transporter ATP-binding protein
VSLYDVIQGLRSSRKRLLAPAGEPSVLGDLHAKRERLETEIGELVTGGRRWAKVSIELEECDAQQTQLEAELKETERSARRLEVALGLKPLWADRARVEADRLKYAGLQPLPTGALARLDELNAKGLEHQQQREVTRGQRKQLHEEIRELGLNEALVRSGCRLDALSEQQDWLAALDRQAKEVGVAADKLAARIDAEAGRLAKLWRHKPTAETAPTLTEDTLERLRPAAEAVSYAEQLVAEAKRDLDARRGDPLLPIRGSPPDLAAPPPGCRFAPRCPIALPRCGQEQPPLDAQPDGTQVACWRADESTALMPASAA